MIDWSKISRQDFDLIVIIAKRYEREVTGRLPGEQWRTLLLDLQACHISCPLDLPAMLTEPLADFGHDIGGIQRYIARETGQLKEYFTPRCARRP